MKKIEDVNIKKLSTLKKTKLNYIKAVEHIPPAERIPVGDTTDLNRGIRNIIEQNTRVQISAEEVTKNLRVR